MVTESCLLPELTFDVVVPRIVPSVPGEDLRISATAFMTFRRCPQRANARFQGLYEAPSTVSFTGSLAHQIFKRHLTLGAIEPSDFINACRQEMGKNFGLGSTSVELGLKPKDLTGVFQQVQGFYETFVRFPDEGLTAAEVIFEIVVADGLTLVGQVDAVFGTGSEVRLVDWKTGALGEAEGQMMFYALLWLLDREQLPSSIEAISVKTGEKFAHTPGEIDIARIATEIGEMVDSLRTAWASGGELERRGGPWCQYCPILEGCSEGEATMEMLAG